MGGGADVGGDPGGNEPQPHGDYLEAIDDTKTMPNLAVDTTFNLSFAHDLLANDWIPSHPLSSFRSNITGAESSGDSYFAIHTWAKDTDGNYVAGTQVADKTSKGVSDGLEKSQL